jgi:membrane-bound lytic murein transglycosylase D
MLLAASLMAPEAGRASQGGNSFPEYPSLKPNVDFWESVYSHYTTRQGILHDSRDLSRIYAVIKLRPTTEAGNRKRNRKTIKAAKAHWAGLLRELAKSGSVAGWPDTALARRLKTELSAKELRAAADQVRCQVGQADRFREGLVRSGAYLDQIRAIFKQEGLPQDLGYLPHVESSFNIKAYSKFGAAGIWQFTRSTGRRFMQIGYTVDERRDPIAASHAAARLLAENYAKLGSWPLAITAYNHGAAGMARAKARHGSFPEIVARYKSRSFKFASRNFYAEFLAARRVASDHERYFGELKLDTPEKIHRVALKNFAAIEAVGEHFDVDVATLRDYNPALRPPVFRGQKYIPRGYVLNLPHATPLLAKAETLDLPADLYFAKQKPSRFYTVQPGDTAGRVARLHGIRLGDLILANNLDRRATIYVNQNLRLPQPGESAVLLASAKPLTSVAVKAKPVIKVEAPAPQPQAQPSKPEPLVATAATPDLAPVPITAAVSEAAQTPETTTLVEPPAEVPLLASLIPEPFPVTIGHLAEPQVVSIIGEVVVQEKPVATDKTVATGKPYDMWMFQAGSGPLAGTDTDMPLPQSAPDQRVEVAQATPRGLNLAMVTGHLKVERRSEEDGIQVGYIMVEVEETLGHFADWLEIRTQVLRRLNGFTYGQVLHTHQRIKIPFNKVPQEAFEERRFEYHQRIQEDFFAAFQVESLNTYKVKSGDSLWNLASETFAVPMWLLKRCNPDVDFSALRRSQELLVPVVEKLPDQAAAFRPGKSDARLSRAAANRPKVHL